MCHSPSQLELCKPLGGVTYQDVSKTNQGGLKHRKESKVVIQYANTADRRKCTVRLYKLYNEKYPPDRLDNAFYLKPLSKPAGDIWFQPCPVGRNIMGSSACAKQQVFRDTIPTILCVPLLQHDHLKLESTSSSSCSVLNTAPLLA